MTQGDREALLAKHGFGPCGHPDCDQARPQCASNIIRAKAAKLLTEAYLTGRLDYRRQYGRRPRARR